MLFLVKTRVNLNRKSITSFVILRLDEIIAPMLFPGERIGSTSKAEDTATITA